MNTVNQPTFPNNNAKSIFESKTFWGAALTALAAIAPIIGDAVSKHELSVQHTVNIVIILATTGATVAGRVQAESPVFTPDGFPGPNKSDFETNASKNT
ncbi:hypothetical protein [Argonema galeatum]|uniref:hypothetical protein n=1 Tax=Argonema galeatum TaxID=2942762 RepID=UPI002012FF3E|nr:hypothetical protein [Argonema galeatum]MCL1463243.1 hypothetical protein [Argonema galeatum A003/A1]